MAFPSMFMTYVSWFTERNSCTSNKTDFTWRSNLNTLIYREPEEMSNGENVKWTKAQRIS